MANWERDTCKVCGTPIWLYRGTDGDFWQHDEPQRPIHLAEPGGVPDVVADVADERRKEYHTETGPSYWPDIDPPEDAIDYGGLDEWTPAGLL